MAQGDIRMNQNGNVSIHDLQKQFNIVEERANDILENFDKLLDSYRSLQRVIAWLFLTNLISIIVIFFLATK